MMFVVIVIVYLATLLFRFIVSMDYLWSIKVEIKMDLLCVLLKF